MRHQLITISELSIELCHSVVFEPSRPNASCERAEGGAENKEVFELKRLMLTRFRVNLQRTVGWYGQ
jgi:hypothetical protein